MQAPPRCTHGHTDGQVHPAGVRTGDCGRAPSCPDAEEDDGVADDGVVECVERELGGEGVRGGRENSAVVGLKAGR